MGYQIPNFTYPGGPAEIFPRVVAQAREAEAAGFDTVLLMDHFYQLPGIGKPNEPMLECYTALGGAGQRHQDRSALVAGHRQHLSQPGNPG
jgi:alkanesulfonate monooxygenase SsuD/methylene tetrahydromethanopterin reductase-like flavin-dependent oxidoreductase (luciferase family)